MALKKGVLKSLKNILSHSFYLDKRALGIARIYFGFILLFDLIGRSKFLKLHYTDHGVLPLELLFKKEWHEFYLSIHSLSGTTEWQIILFVIHGFLAISMLLGYRTKASIFLSWLLLIALHNRNPLVLNSGDVYFRMILLWSLFLPMGARYSLDQLFKSRGTKENRFTSLASFAFILQVMLVYLMGVLLKSSFEWLHDGTALYYALSLDQMVKPLGHYLLQFPHLLKAMTFSTVFIEFIAPFLLVFPLFNTRFRTLGILLLISLHIGIELTMEVGLFSFISIGALIALTPSQIMAGCETFFSKLLPPPQPQAKTYRSAAYSINSILKIFKKGALILLIGYVLLWNIQTLPDIPSYFNNKITKAPAQILRLDQRWSMFAPSVYKNDGWYIFEAQLSSGKTIDLFRQEEIKKNEYLVPPSDVFSYYKNARWRKYLGNLHRKNEPIYFKNLTYAFLTRWNSKTHRTSIVEKATIYYILEKTPLLNNSVKRKKIKLYQQDYSQ